MPDAVQDRYAPDNACFGCGPSNPAGLRIKSRRPTDADLARHEDDGLPTAGLLVADWQPAAMHEAFPGMLSGGIAGTLLDCHLNWTAAIHLMDLRGLDHPPCTVTARYSVALRRPTPTSGPLSIRGWVTAVDGDKVNVEGELSADGVVCATCRGLFVSVQEGHPAFHRW